MAEKKGTNRKKAKPVRSSVKPPEEYCAEEELDQWQQQQETLRHYGAFIGALQDRISNLEASRPGQVISQAWYKSWGVWLAIILALAALYLVYIFAMSEAGYPILLPSWLK